MLRLQLGLKKLRMDMFHDQHLEVFLAILRAKHSYLPLGLDLKEERYRSHKDEELGHKPNTLQRPHLIQFLCD